MPLTDQAFADHALWATRARVSEMLAQATEHADGQAMAQVGRLVEALAAVGGLAVLPAWRFPQEGNALTNLNSGLTQVEVTLQNVVDDPAADAAALADGLAPHLDTIAQYLMQCPVPAVTSDDLKRVASVAAEYRQLVEGAMGKIQANLAEAEAAVASTEQARSESEANATAALDDLKAAGTGGCGLQPRGARREAHTTGPECDGAIPHQTFTRRRGDSPKGHRSSDLPPAAREHEAERDVRSTWETLNQGA